MISQDKVDGFSCFSQHVLQQGYSDCDGLIHQLAGTAVPPKIHRRLAIRADFIQQIVGGTTGQFLNHWIGKIFIMEVSAQDSECEVSGLQLVGEGFEY